MAAKKKTSLATHAAKLVASVPSPWTAFGYAMHPGDSATTVAVPPSGMGRPTAPGSPAFSPAIGAPAAPPASALQLPFADPNSPEQALTPDQQVSFGQQYGTLDNADAAATGHLQTAQTEHDYGVSQAQQIFGHSTAAANGDSAARGVFQSSLRDAALDDIRRTRDTNVNMLDTRLNQVRQEVGNPNDGTGILGRDAQQRRILDGARTQQNVENKKQANSDYLGAQPASAVQPPVSVVRPAPATAPAKPSTVTHASGWTAWGGHRM